MYNLFDFLYSPSGSVLYYILMYIYIGVAIFAAILFVVILIMAIKTKKKSAFITSALLFLISYLALTPFFEMRAIMKSSGMTLSMIKNHQVDIAYLVENHNSDILRKNMEIAAKLSLFPAQKGFIYLQLGNMTGIQDKDSAFKYYEKAYKYLKTYKSSNWVNAFGLYTYWGHYDTALKIAEENHQYYLCGFIYGLMNNYDKALLYTTRAIIYNPKYANLYATRAMIYRNLNKEDKALADYKKALSLCKDAECTTTTKKKYEGYKTYYSDYRKKSLSNKK